MPSPTRLIFSASTLLSLASSLNVPRAAAPEPKPEPFFGLPAFGSSNTGSGSSSAGTSGVVTSYAPVVCNTLNGVLPLPLVPTHTAHLLNINPVPVKVVVTSTPIVVVTAPVITTIATQVSTIVSELTFFTSTSTIAAPAGFLGVLQTGTPSSGGASRRRDLLATGDEASAKRRGILDGLLNGLVDPIGALVGGSSDAGGSTNSKLVSLNQVQAGNVGLYPLAVQCMAVTSILTRITSTITAAVSTSTSQPYATTTTTVTTTTTASLYLPTTTYLACGPQNLLGPTLPQGFGSLNGEDLSGQSISDIYYDSSSVALMTTIGSSAYDCCAQCIQMNGAAAGNGCAYGAYLAQGRCFLLDTADQSCPAQGSVAGLVGQYVSTTADVDPNSMAYSVYDGGCGVLAFGGEDPDYS